MGKSFKKFLCMRSLNFKSSKTLLNQRLSLISKELESIRLFKTKKSVFSL